MTNKSATNLRDVGIIATIVLVSVILLKFSSKDDSIKVAPAGASAAVAAANQSVVNPSSQIAGDFKEESANLTDTFQALPESSSESIANVLEPSWTVSRAIDDTVVTDVPPEIEATSGTVNSGTSRGGSSSSGGTGDSSSGDSSDAGATGERLTGGYGTSGDSTSSGSGSTDTVSGGQDSTGVTITTGDGGSGGGTGGSDTGTSTDSLVNDVTDKTPTSTGSVSQLDSNYSTLDVRNKAALFDRLTTAFDQHYQANSGTGGYYDPSRNFASGDVALHSIYYLRQELQAFIDMWRATGSVSYLNKAKELTFKAMADANANPHILLWGSQHAERGTFPCFFNADLEGITGGHGQNVDFQGSDGFMMVASALKQANMDGWQDISDFVEDNIIEKWLYRDPDETYTHLIADKYNVLYKLNGARDQREHFADICLDMNELGYEKYPYRDWSQSIFDIYLTEKTSLDELWPDANVRGLPIVPDDWGLYHQGDGTLIWSWGLSDLVNYGILDTSHASRTIWATCQAFEKGMLPNNATLNNLIISFKKNIWAVQKGSFYFNNMINGTDPNIYGMGPGGIGNLWFGWHRLAAYDNTLKDLFISLAYDLTNGGYNIHPPYAQNKDIESTLCFYAWAARLISSQGKPEVFP